MHFLILSIVSSVCIAIVIRTNESRDLDRYGVMLFNYLTASILSLFLADRTGLLADFRQLAWIGGAAGLLFVTAFLVYMKSVRRLGMAIPVTVTRLSVVIPALGSIVIYSERIDAFQAAGLVLALVAIYLFSWRGSGTRVNPDRADLYLPPLLFLLMGSGDFSLKIFESTFPEDMMMSFVLLVFLVASVYSLGLLLFRGRSVDRRVIGGGILLGIPNFASAWFILKVLQVLPGSIAFPLNNVGIIMLSTLVGYTVWHERFGRRALAAMVLAVVAVILLGSDPG